MDQIINNVKKLIKSSSDDEKIELLNEIRKDLHELSPLKNEPVDYVKWVKSDNVMANDYNPNAVAPPEMELLGISIMADGFTQPIVTYPENGKEVVVDGFHRNRIGKENKEIQKKLQGYLPIVKIRPSQEDKGNRMASTIRHNRARGKHQISKMSDIILNLKRRKWSDEKIANELGMSADEVLRLGQITGLAEMFKNKEFSKAWEIK